MLWHGRIESLLSQGIYQTLEIRDHGVAALGDQDNCKIELKTREPHVLIAAILVVQQQGSSRAPAAAAAAAAAAAPRLSCAPYSSAASMQDLHLAVVPFFHCALL